MPDTPNLIYIVADQWRGDCLGLYQNQHPVMTPHLNQLACEGTNYSRAYADCPICMPQRMTMLSGRTGSQLRCIKNFSAESAPSLDPETTLPARLANEAGYQTKAIGKMHFAQSRARYGFDHVTLHPDDYLWWLEDMGQGGTFRDHGLGGNEVYPTSAVTDQRYYHTTWMIDQAIRYLDQHDPCQPFFLFIIFEAPHSPFDPPPPYDRMYDNFTIPDSTDGNWRESDYPSAFETRRIRSKFDYIQADAAREARRRYYGQMSHIDYQLGRLIGSLQSKGLYHDTAIAFTSDHGECLGDHGIYAKHCFLEAAARVPLILRVPERYRQATESNKPDTPVLTADLYSTFLDLAGVELSNEPEGKSLLQPLKREYIFGETPESAMCQNQQYKYVYYPSGGIEHLFNLSEDTNDINNLSNDTAHKAIKEQLRSELINYLSKNKSPMVENQKLVTHDPDINIESLRRANPAACRGPMHGGDGY